jgi:uncharacterized protein with NAD-binding domain and iron-sulfur cluster
MKKLALAVLLTLILSVPALAAVQEFEKFKIDVPSGWQAISAGMGVTLTSNDGSAISIAVIPGSGQTPKALAEATAQQMGSAVTEADGFYVVESKVQTTSTKQYFKALGSDILNVNAIGSSSAIPGIIKSIAAK